jgi:hypothetical protein
MRTAQPIRPQALAVRPEGIPKALRAIPRWVLWRYVSRQQADGQARWTKVPYSVEGGLAAVNNPQTWSTFDSALAAPKRDSAYDGLGIILTGDFHGIDLDDCRNPETGDLSALALEVLERIEGYAEVSPSGTGIKLYTHTNMHGARTDRAAGVELYVTGRYFCVTGHCLSGHDRLPSQVQDITWLIERIWGAAPSPQPQNHGRTGDVLQFLRAPLADWDLPRVVAQVLPHLDPDVGYGEWLKVGQILHHQGQGEECWCDAWDQWSSESDKYTPGLCTAKWASFKAQRLSGKGPATLASLLEQAAQARKTLAHGSVDRLMASFESQIATASHTRDIEYLVAPAIGAQRELGDSDRALLEKQIRARVLELNGSKVAVAAVRAWFTPKVVDDLPDRSIRGHPLATIENLECLLARRQITVRYNVIKKQLEFVIPGAQYSRENEFNSATSTVISMVEKAGMSSRLVPEYLATIGDKTPFNPVITWVTSKPWDNRSRLEEFYSTIESASPLKQKLIRKWLVQAIDAAFAPEGIAGQGVITFLGAQGAGKTSFFRKLAPPELNLVLTGLNLDLRTKDSTLIAVKFWIVELGELDASFRKSDLAALKAWLTQDVDVIRKPFARGESSMPRRTVFGGSVNERQFLQDKTGNRRFWVLPVDRFDIHHSIDMQQLWAEVRTLWEAGEPYHLDESERNELNEHNDEFVASDPVEERIGFSLDWDSDPSTWEELTVTQILIRCGSLQPTRYEAISASRAIRALNGDRSRRSNGRKLFAVPKLKVSPPWGP